MTYKFGGSLPADDYNYIERQADLDLYQYLMAGEFCYVLNSRQTGKSSLMVRTMHKLTAQEIACGKIDLSVIGSKEITPAQWYFGIIHAISDNFNLLKFFELRNWYKEHELLSPVERLNQFIDKVLLKKVSKKIIIFVDEIDSILSLDFKFDDLFASIRGYYNNRATNPEYNRLTFTILGVADPHDLISDDSRTPFNIGRAIQLHPFSLDNALNLGKRLTNFSEKHRNIVLQEIVKWTGGQPFLTLKLCHLILEQGTQKLESPSEISDWIKQLVEEKVINNWKTNDQPEHLRTIRDRLTRNQYRANKLLGSYQKILQQGEINADNIHEEIELLLSGIVLKENNKLTVYNPIYESIFNLAWINQQLENLRPYYEVMIAWLASNCEDESRLLRGKALKEAEKWAENKDLNQDDYQFLKASRKAENKEKLEVEESLRKKEEQSNQRLLKINEEIKIKNQEIEEKVKQLELKNKKSHQTLKICLFLGVLGIFIGIGGLLFGRRSLSEAKKIAKEEIVNKAVIFSKLYQSTSIFDNGKQIEGLENIILGIQNLQYLEILPKKKYRFREFILDKNLAEEIKENDKQLLLNLELELEDILKKIALKNQFKASKYKLTSLSFNHDGTLLATGDEKGNIIIWNISTGKKLQELENEEDNDDIINSIKFSPDGRLVATASQNGSIKIWEQEQNTSYSSNLSSPQASFRLLTTLSNQTEDCPQTGTKAIYDLEFSPDGRLVATASQNGSIKIWEQEQNISYSSNLSSPQASFRLLTTLSNQTEDCPQTGTKAIYDLEFSPDGKGKILAFTEDKEGKVSEWNIDNNSLTPLIKDEGIKESIKSIRSLSFSNYQQDNDNKENKKLLAMGDINGKVIVLNLENKEESKILHIHEEDINDISFSPDNKLLAIASQDGTLNLWEIENLWSTDRSIFYEPPLHTTKLKNNAINSISFTPNGKLLAITTKDGFVQFWDVEKIKYINRKITELTLSSDRQHLAIATEKGKGIVYLKNLQENTEEKIYDEATAEISSLSFGELENYPQLLAVGFRNGTIKLLNLQKDSKDNQNLIASYPKSSKIIDNDSPNNQILSMTFTKKQNMMAVSTWEGKIKLLKWVKGELKEREDFQLQFEKQAKSISFTPDGKHLAIGFDNGDVKLWDWQKDEIISEFNAHPSPIYSLNFISHSNQAKLVTASEDNTIKIWELSDNKNRIYSFDLKKLSLSINSDYSDSEKPLKIISFDFSPDGKYLAIHTFPNSNVYLWDLQENSLKQSRQFSESIYNINFLSEDKLAINGENGTVNIWQLTATPLQRLDKLKNEGCDWLQDYLNTAQQKRSPPSICSK